MSYHVVDDRGMTMGFSLRPPKWLRKAQPGKILKKIALPAAALATAFFIPGAAAAIATGVTRGSQLLFHGGRAALPALRAGARLAPSIPQIGIPVQSALAPSVPTPASRSLPPSEPFVPAGAGGSPGFAMPSSGGLPMTAGNGADAGEPTTQAAAATVPGKFPVVPVLIGAAALLLFSRRR